MHHPHTIHTHHPPPPPVPPSPSLSQDLCKIRPSQNIMYELSLTEAMAPASGAEAGPRDVEPQA
eukprot:364208-Chlamydomonas_euryale.AAC.23